MNLNWFREAMKKSPGQGSLEWQLFLEFIEAYFHNRDIRNPIVVEIGTRRNRQKAFYELLLGARHIGIDISDKFVTPDILGDSKNPKTLEILKKSLKGESINLLFIDGDHTYEGVKSDYELYAPLVSHIIVFHDISSPKHGVWKLWNELTNPDKEFVKRSIKIGWATGLLILEGEKGIYETHPHKGRYL